MNIKLSIIMNISPKVFCAKDKMVQMVEVAVVWCKSHDKMTWKHWKHYIIT